MSLKIILTKGLPASGKTTWANEMVKNNPDIMNVCKDDIREAMVKGTKEKEIINARDAMTESFLKSGKSVIWSDTNLNPIHEKRAKELSEKYNAIVEVKDFTHVTLKECIERDSKRVKTVGATVIKSMYNQYQRTKVKTYDFVHRKQDSTLPKAIICDLDGTLAKIHGRNPYDASECEKDLLNEPVKKILEVFKRTGTKILLVSGRKDCYRTQTENWLKLHNINYDLLIMRQTSDNRKDSVIKKEIYESQIESNYYIDFILDDRNQVVDMWRELGLTCLQVDYGDF